MFDKFFNLSTQLAKDSLAPMWTQAHQTAAKADAANAKDPGSPKTLALLEKAASEARTAFKLADKADMPTDFLKNAHRFADLRTKISHDAQIAVRPEPGWKGERHS